MSTKGLTIGDCVRLPDGRIGRVRAVRGKGIRVRVRRHTSKTHQFLEFPSAQLERVECPPGWMSPPGYRRYLRVTLAKMKPIKGLINPESRLSAAASL